MTAPARHAMPTRVYVYVAAVAVATLVLLPFCRLADGAVRGSTAVFDALILTLLIALAYQRPIEIGPKRKVNVSTAAEVAAVLLLPGPIAVLTLTVGGIAGEAMRSVRLVQRVFNTTLAMLRAIVGASVFAGVSQLEPGAITDLAAYLAAPVAMYLSTFVLIRGIVAVQLEQSPLSRSALPPPELVLAEVALSFTGILTALAATVHAWALLLLVAPIALADRAVRTTVALREQRRVAEEALVSAEAALTTRDEFLSLASHELRTPLTALQGNTELLARRLAGRDTSQDIRQLLTQSGRQIDRIATLIETLLDVSRIRSGTFVVEVEPVSLGSLVRQVVQMYQTTTQPPRVIDLTLPPSPPIVQADAGRLEQVLVNLFDNAYKFSRPGTPVHVSVEMAEATASVAVRDEGIGIPVSEQDQIFSRFRRGTNIDQGIAGLGLGLYIADELVRAQGGHLTCRSVPGIGSTFTITLPKYDAVTDLSSA
jgi:signal transduction histidine kinase